MDLHLDNAPRLTALYGTAVAGSVRARMGGGMRQTKLPTDRHRVEGVTANGDHVRAFQELMRQPATEFLPSGYIHVLAFPVAMSVLARPDFPLPLLGMIHLRNEVEHLRPATVKETLAVTASVENLQRHRSGTQVETVVLVEDDQGPLWRGRSTYLAKGILLGDARAGSAETEAATARPNQPVPDYPTAVWQLGADTGRRYAAVSGDYNPIHLSGFSARLLGMKRPIAHGMYLASRMVAEVGPGEMTPFRWSVDFHAPVSLPSQVALTAEVRRTSEWHGAEVTAWDPRRRRAHFSGRLEKLESTLSAG